MGLLDVLGGMSNAESGQGAPGSSARGMSPITKAIIGVLAYQAIKAFTGSNQASAGTKAGRQDPQTTGGELDDLLKGGLGGLLGGGAAGSVVSGGLNDLLKQFQQNDDLLSELSRQLPGVVDQLTPDGRLPTEQAARFV